MSTLSGARVAFVSGKGGVGKTTVATALALAAAKEGRHVLLVELEDREAFAPIFGLDELGYEERAIAPNLAAVSVQPDESLVEYLQHFYGIPKLSRALVHSKAVEFATGTAPGLRDILLIGKVKEAEQRRNEGAHVYDLVVVDAPPTGRLPRFLDAPRAIVDLVQAGPIRKQAQGVLDMVQDHKRAQVVLVTTPEDMSARETAEAAETMEKMGIALGPVVVNGLWRELPGLSRGTAATLRADADAAGIALSDEAFAQLAEITASHAKRAHAQRAIARDLAKETGLAQVELPFLFTERIGKAEIEKLAAILAAPGAL